MFDRTSFINLSRIVIPLFALGLLVNLSFGHGGEKHGAESDHPADSSDALDIGGEKLDSAYAWIQNGFVALEPTFKKGCFDCHTTETDFPWYVSLPIVKGIIEDDVTEAKKHLDMSDGFPFGGHGKPADDLVAIREVLEKESMPPLRYRFMHWSAKPSEEEVVKVNDWITSALDTLKALNVFPTSGGHDTGEIAESKYVCPMHPEVTSDHPGECAKCGMPLEPVHQGDDGHSEHDHDHDL